jgi:DNA-binding MarR family transcriptional regulator
MIDEDICNDSFYCITGDFDWESFFPSAHRLMESPSYYLLRVLTKLQRNMKEHMAGLDLTNTQFKLLLGLVVLTKDGNTFTQTGLANFLGLDKMMVSDVLRTLERKGYVIRVSNPKDKRAKSLLVTEKGLKTAEKALEEALSIEDGFFSVLGDDRDEFIRILKKLL